MSRSSTTRKPRPPSVSWTRGRFYRRHGITVERLITDNGSAYRSALHAIACRTLAFRHLRTRPTARRPTARPNA
jgi:hypothetical protein